MGNFTELVKPTALCHWPGRTIVADAVTNPHIGGVVGSGPFTRVPQFVVTRDTDATAVSWDHDRLRACARCVHVDGRAGEALYLVRALTVRCRRPI